MSTIEELLTWAETQDFTVLNVANVSYISLHSSALVTNVALRKEENNDSILISLNRCFSEDCQAYIENIAGIPAHRMEKSWLLFGGLAYGYDVSSWYVEDIKELIVKLYTFISSQHVLDYIDEAAVEAGLEPASHLKSKARIYFYKNVNICLDSGLIYLSLSGPQCFSLKALYALREVSGIDMNIQDAAPSISGFISPNKIKSVINDIKRAIDFLEENGIE